MVMYIIMSLLILLVKGSIWIFFGKNSFILLICVGGVILDLNISYSLRQWSI
jgi:hypothetical protein